MRVLDSLSLLLWTITKGQSITDHSPGRKACTAIDSRLTDAYCNNVCNHDPPYCPSGFCYCAAVTPAPVTPVTPAPVAELPSILPSKPPTGGALSNFEFVGRGHCATCYDFWGCKSSRFFRETDSVNEATNTAECAQDAIDNNMQAFHVSDTHLGSSCYLIPKQHPKLEKGDTCPFSASTICPARSPHGDTHGGSWQWHDNAGGVSPVIGIYREFGLSCYRIKDLGSCFYYPCQHGGSCTVMADGALSVGGRKCDCVNGYSGESCEIGSGRKACTAIDSRATDSWCNNICNHDPSHCPSGFCSCAAEPSSEQKDFCAGLGDSRANCRTQGLGLCQWRKSGCKFQKCKNLKKQDTCQLATDLGNCKMKFDKKGDFKRCK